MLIGGALQQRNDTSPCLQSSRDADSHLEHAVQARSTSVGTAAGHTCHAKLEGRLGNSCGHFGGDLPQLPQLWVDFGSRDLLWGDCTQGKSAVVSSIGTSCRLLYICE